MIKSYTCQLRFDNPKELLRGETKLQLCRLGRQGSSSCACPLEYFPISESHVVCDDLKCATGVASPRWRLCDQPTPVVYKSLRQQEEET